MDKIPLDEEKVRFYAQIQENLCNLSENSSDEDIDKLINQIPTEYLTQKADLMKICELFALYARYHALKSKRSTFKLFDKIMSQIKSILPDESSFFWRIFGGHLYFKYWLYQKGLISIDYVILCAQLYRSKDVIEVFLPDIIELRPELFDKELKYVYNQPFTEEYIKEYRKKREVHLKWLQNSCDYNDSIYDQIETNRLRLSMKRDDIDTFQRLLSESNQPIESKISELTFECQFISPSEHTLLDYSIFCNALKIFKFLILNDAKPTEFTVYHTVSSNNYEIIHIIESKINEQFSKNALKASLCLWNKEIIEYLLENYIDNYNFLTNEGEILDECNYDDAVFVFDRIVSSSNFIFFESTILPFLKKNPLFVEKKIYDLIFVCLNEMSCFFLRCFLKYDKIDLNFHSKDNNYTILAKSLEYENSVAIEIILSNKNIEINEAAFSCYPAVFFACKRAVDMMSVDLICNYPNFDINQRDSVHEVTAFDLALSTGNFYVTDYFLKKFPNVDVSSMISLINNHLYSLKIGLNFLISKKNFSPEYILKKFFNGFKNDDDFQFEYVETLKQIIIELGFECPDVIKEEEEEEEEESFDVDDINKVLELLCERIKEMEQEKNKKEEEDDDEDEREN